MIEMLRAWSVRRWVQAGVACAFLALPRAGGAQTVVPATACDAALANPDLHPQPQMPLENGTIAFSYNAEGPFVSGGGAYLSITVALTFQPSPNATIKVAALDDACSGGSGAAATLFSFTFDEMTATRNTITYDASANLLVFNGTVERATPQGHVRYLFIDVWDGELPSTHAAYSYVIDLQNPANPTQ